MRRYLWPVGDAADIAQDRPILQERDDELDRSSFVESLARSLVREVHDKDGKLLERRATGSVIGLTGSWGSGKSSIINLLALHLSSKNQIIVANFNPWLFRGRDELLMAFFNELRGAIGRSKVEDAKELIGALDRYRGALEATAHIAAAGLDVLGTGGAASATVATGKTLWRRPKKPGPAESIADERHALESKLKHLKSAVVVLIDELDRVDDEDVRAVAQLVKAVGDIKGISYLVAYDPDRVAEALGRGEGHARTKSGWAYLEKIVQHPIPLRPLFSEDVDRLLTSAFARHGYDLPADVSDADKALLDQLKLSISTPREVKRLIGSFVVIEDAVRGEVNPVHVLCYSWLLTKSPDLQARLSRDPDKYVDDPSEAEIYRRVRHRSDRTKEEITDAIFMGEGASEHLDLLKMLFPRFGTDETSFDGTRLSRRLNLIKVLYLGNPPGSITKQDIEALWSLSDRDDVEKEVRELLGLGSLSNFLDRFDDLVDKLPTSGDEVFWPGLARALTRASDWVSGPEPARALADDAGTTLFRIGLRDRRQMSRVKSIVGTLIQNDDLVLVPWILRKAMFQNGLVVGQPARHGELIFDKAETQDLLAHVIPKYRESLLNGTLLRRIPTMEALFVLKNGGFWDGELYGSLTHQITEPSGLETFAAVMTPPGYVIEQKTLSELVDLETLLKTAASMKKPGDPWVALSVRRLRLTAEGKDTIFDQGEE